MKKPIVLLVLLCGAVIAQAQNSIDLLTIGGRYGFPSNYETPFENQQATESGMLVNVKLPIVFNEKKTIWYNNLTYTYSNVTNNFPSVDGIMNPIQIHGFILQTGILQRLDDKRALMLLYVPRFMSDFQGYSSRSWQHGAIGMFEYRWSEDFMMRFGLMYNPELGGTLLVPLFDINWKISDKWNMAGLFPIYLKVNYLLNERWTLGFSHFGLITSYALYGEGYAGDYMERTSIDLTLFARWKVAGNWHLEGRFGYALNRTYAQYDADQQVDFRLSIIKFGDNRTEPNNILFNDGLLANLRLVYSIPLE